ncbi:MAG: hypothetical protein O3A20_08350 [Planctomycetota bacterium]|nr:hypothetical protein [Planctomycetota bacterium]
MDELRLFIAALLRLLCAQGTIDANELRSLVEAIDGEDGNADGRHRGPLLPEADPSGPATPPSNSR